MPELENLDMWLRPEDIGKEADVEITTSHKLLKKEDTSFENDVFEVEIRLKNGEKRSWTMNKTSSRMVAMLHGTNSDKWIGKKVKLYTTVQNVRGKEKSIIYVRGKN